jgi:MoxR-like ATPase
MTLPISLLDDNALPAKDMPMLDLAGAHQIVVRLRDRMRAAVKGRDDVIELVLIALLADGHVLLEDYPGSGKTLMAKTLGDSIIDDKPDDDIPSFRRIQFTPDLLPSDVTGVTVFDTNTNKFFFRRGPVFAYVVLADEINRTSPKVQSAMLEAMAEKQVTVDNTTNPLDELFFVIATQNPLDLAGTYPLPLAQLDRFLFKIRMMNVSREAELDVLATARERREGVPDSLPRVNRGDVVAARKACHEHVSIAPAVHEALVDIARALRADRRVLQGASTRSLVMALPALQARAMMHDRDHVTPEDVAALLGPIFGHRLELAPGIDDPSLVIRESSTPLVERMARVSLQRMSV